VFLHLNMAASGKLRIIKIGYFNVNLKEQAYVRGSIKKFPDWPHGARSANGTALCH
jgi:hypothetical protein